MDIVEQLNLLVDSAGLSGAVSLMALLIVILIISMFSKRIQALTDAIITLSDRVESPHLSSEESMMIYNAVMKNHVTKKLEFLADILEKNSIQTRRTQIEKNIEREFRKITSDETAKLSMVKSKCGDMGMTVRDRIIWDDFMEDVFEVFFQEGPEIRQKISDIKILMTDIVDSIGTIIKENGIHNC